MIPNIIHFIFGLDKEFGGKPFSYIHFLSIYTAFITHRPEKIYFHYEFEPSGIWWERSKPYISLVRTFAPDEIFGNRITHFAHKADIMRLEALYKHGGIYLDIDVISVNSFDNLRTSTTVMGIEKDVGLCNAVILAEKNSPFIYSWHKEYMNFDKNNWNNHSVKVPMRLWRENKNSVQIQNEYAFFYPMYNDPSHIFLWEDRSKHEELRRRLLASSRIKTKAYLTHIKSGGNWQYNTLSKSYCIHLWESLWFDRYLKNITPRTIEFDNSNFSRVIRNVISKSSQQEYKNW